MIEAIFFTIGLFLGYLYRDIRDNIEEIWGRMYDVENALPHKKPGVTMGSYKHVDEASVAAQPIKPARGHVVTPKTPQKMDWDAEQQLKDENQKFRVGPR